jgi:hydrogenase expression/formation protein HypE
LKGEELPHTLSLGKPDSAYLHKVIYRRLGARRREVIVGPKFGVDNAIVRVGRGRVMVATADPLSFIPSLGARESAWLSVNLIASDLTTSGLAPQYGIFDFNLPPRMKDSDLSDYWASFHNECKRLGLAIIGGHTGRYAGCDYTVIGGGIMCAIGAEDRYLTSRMAKADDDIILTKGAAIETTAVLTRSFPKTVKKALGASLFEQAWRYLRRVSTVRDALTAVSVGVHEEGVTSMHDATEGGVVAAVLELASAAELGAEIDLQSIPIARETREICEFFKIDPLISLSEGSLVITCKPYKTTKVLAKLKAAKIESSVIGQATSRTLHVYGTSRKGRKRVRYPKSDPYWKAYWGATRKHWT